MSGLESMDSAALEDMTQISVDRSRSRLIAVAIMADMEKKGRTLAVVVRPYAYEHEALDGRIDIPTGFVTDFASIPKTLHFLIHPFGRHAPAAVIHDYLYALGQERARRYADLVFLEAMRESGVPWLRRSAMYRMVRMFGGGGYGLKADWSFVDHETGDPTPPPEERPILAWLDRKTRAARRAASQVLT